MRANPSRIMAKTLDCFYQKAFWKSAIDGEIFGHTHKIAISNHRTKSIDQQNVSFWLQGLPCSGHQKTNDTHASGVYQAICVAYFTQRFCQDSSLCFFWAALGSVRSWSFYKKNSKLKYWKSEKRSLFCLKYPRCKTSNLHPIAFFDQSGPPAWFLGGS